VLQDLAKALFAGNRLDLDDYYDLLVDAVVYLPVFGVGADASAVGFEIDGTNFGLLFMTPECAEPVLRRTSFATVERLLGRQGLRLIPDGWGVIVDWNTDSELRITPDAITELNERAQVREVTVEASDAWLSRVNAELADVPAAERPACAKERWSRDNGFRVVPGSRRERAIDHFFAAHADGPYRCEEVWGREYAAAPYLRHLDGAQLRERRETVLTNLAFADRVVAPDELTPHEWAEHLQHVRFESARRGIAFDDDPRAHPPELLDASSAPRGQLFRFSKRRYLEPLLDTGALTIFPAAIYSDPSLRPAQRDDELARTLSSESGRRRMASRTNYYVWFATWSFDPRLFDDFHADACLVINDVHEFTDRLMPAVSEALPDPDWVGAGKPIRYYDPVRPDRRVFARFEKDFRYAYQREFRFVWEPTKVPRTALPPLQCSVGPLGDICTLITSGAPR